LGFFYENGVGGLPKDEREAARFYRLAADAGFAEAETAVARLSVSRKRAIGQQAMDATWVP